MQLGIFAKTFPRPTLEQTLDAVVGHGLTHVQFNMSCMGLATLPDKLDEGSCVWISQTLQERGLKMAAISGTFNMVDPNGSRLENNLRRLEVLAEACRWLDTRIITLCTGSLDSHDMWKWHPDNSRKSTWERLVETMRAAAAIADRHEVTLAFEPEINNVVSSVMRARRLLDDVDSPWLKVVIDPANLLNAGDLDRLGEILSEASLFVRGRSARVESLTKGRLVSILEEALDWLGGDVVVAHAKNPPNIKEDAWWPFYRHYLAALQDMGFAGALVMHGLSEDEVGPRAAFLREMLSWVSSRS
jgi:sugar phosphate isomerase/epimerase